MNLKKGELMADETKYSKCRKCSMEFTEPIHQGKVWPVNGEMMTIVVDGYCFSCCMEKAEEATETFNKVLENYPEVKIAFKEYSYNRQLRTSAIILD